MTDPSTTLGRELKAAEDFFELAKGASNPFALGPTTELGNQPLACVKFPVIEVNVSR
jgi:hypothetical protein